MGTPVHMEEQGSTLFSASTIHINPWQNMDSRAVTVQLQPPPLPSKRWVTFPEESFDALPVVPKLKNSKSPHTMKGPHFCTPANGKDGLPCIGGPIADQSNKPLREIGWDECNRLSPSHHIAIPTVPSHRVASSLSSSLSSSSSFSASFASNGGSPIQSRSSPETANSGFSCNALLQKLNTSSAEPHPKEDEAKKYAAFDAIRQDEGVYKGWSNQILGTSLGWSDDIKSVVSKHRPGPLNVYRPHGTST